MVRDCPASPGSVLPDEREKDAASASFALLRTRPNQRCLAAMEWWRIRRDRVRLAPRTPFLRPAELVPPADRGGAFLQCPKTRWSWLPAARLAGSLRCRRARGAMIVTEPGEKPSFRLTRR